MNCFLAVADNKPTIEKAGRRRDGAFEVPAPWGHGSITLAWHFRRFGNTRTLPRQRSLGARITRLLHWRLGKARSGLNCMVQFRDEMKIFKFEPA
jgi:hypothetical protein